MPLQIVNPLDIPNWDDLVLATGQASFFHSSAWARVLHESYGYKPVYFASFEKGKLTSLMPFMEIDSWLTGRRGVSLPFTDECEPILFDKDPFQEIRNQAVDYGEKAGWKYLEWRDGEHFSRDENHLVANLTHDLRLKMEEGELFSRLRDSTRRNIKKATKAGVEIEIGNSRESVETYYRLHCITRKRHGVPPQPHSFFDRILDHVLSKGYGIVVSASHSGRVSSSYIFFHFGKKAIYKFGASDIAYQEFRPNNLVLWEGIKWYRNKGFEVLNFGRTEPGNEGLLQFKRGWGAEERPLKYYRYDIRKRTFQGKGIATNGTTNKLFAHAPIGLLRLLGRVLYRHAG